MQIQEGDKVSFLNEVGQGTVQEISGEEVLVLREDGFEEWFPKNELILFKPLAIDDGIVHKDARSKNPYTRVKPKERGIEEVDLHIHELVERSKGLSNFEMLQIQLDTARKALEKARKANAQKIILIHGVGEGKLRSELHHMLRSMENIRFYDANFLRYGAGATEVDLW